MQNKLLNKFFFLIYVLLSQINFHYKIRFIDIILNKIRMNLLRICGAKIGKNSSIHPNVMLINPQNISLGDNTNIGSNSEIFNYSELIIGDNVDIGTQFYINTNNHIIKDQNKPLAYQGTISKKIVIGSDIWIGARVTILSNVKINDRVVIGAGSLVNRDLESGYLYAGSPAVLKKKLSD